MPLPTKPFPSQWDGNVYGLTAIGQGGAAIVFSVDEYRAIKVPIPSAFGLQAIAQEREIYRRFMEQSESAYVIACYDPKHGSGVLLEKCVGSVRDRLRQMHQRDNGYPLVGSEDALALAGRWAYQAAQGLAYIHSHGVIQADDAKVGCHNMLLDRHGNLKLADFSGSSIENTYRALVTYDLRSRLSNFGEPDKASDLFALGCAIYEMATGHLPYHYLPSKQVQQKLFRKVFPSLEHLERRAPEIAEAIRGCWNVKAQDGFKCAEDVVRVLDIRYNTTQHQADISANVEEMDTVPHKKGRPVLTTKPIRSPKSRNNEEKRRHHRSKGRREDKSSKHTWQDRVFSMCGFLPFRK
ncbi:hypothetical protein PG994_004387 [Apiospora phragmitis]|uniref:Protein kinase domain-containing protein n=1 Tax=Apiospora phragmitis TaxID=2905665 RepID=A0ABR1VUG9_9PEZI